MLNDADIKRQSSLLRKLQVLARDSDLYKQSSDENQDEGTDPGEQTWYSSSPTHMHTCAPKLSTHTKQGRDNLNNSE